MSKNKNNKIILFIAIPNFIVGGAERVFLNIISNIDKRNFLIHLVVGKKRGPLIKLIPDYIIVHELGDEKANKTFIPFLKLAKEFFVNNNESAIVISFLVCIA